MKSIDDIEKLLNESEEKYKAVDLECFDENTRNLLFGFWKVVNENAKATIFLMKKNLYFQAAIIQRASFENAVSFLVVLRKNINFESYVYSYLESVIKYGRDARYPDAAMKEIKKITDLLEIEDISDFKEQLELHHKFNEVKESAICLYKFNKNKDLLSIKTFNFKDLLLLLKISDIYHHYTWMCFSFCHSSLNSHFFYNQEESTKEKDIDLIKELTFTFIDLISGNFQANE